MGKHGHKTNAKRTQVGESEHATTDAYADANAGGDANADANADSGIWAWVGLANQSMKTMMAIFKMQYEA